MRKDLILHRLKLTAQAVMSEAAIVQAVDAEVMIDQMSHRLALRLQAELLAEKVLTEEYTETKHIDISYQSPWTMIDRITRWLCFVVGAIGAAIAVVLASWTIIAFADTFMVAGLFVVFLAGPREPVIIKRDITVKVPATYWRKFPQATFRYPPKLGPYVHVMEAGPAYFEDPFFGEEESP